MQEELSTNANAGVHSQNGFALQRNAALYIFLSDYHSKFRGNNYFICLEHHDDFLFCFLDKDGCCESIDAYQSKKASSDWTIRDDLITLISKLLNTGIQLTQDNSLSKKYNYIHKLYFSSNRPIKLEQRKTKNCPLISTKINEENCLVSFNELPEEIRDKINTKIIESINSESGLDLDKLHFFYIDLAKTDAAQQEQIVGKISTLFGQHVTDPKAAKDTIIQLFRNVETVFNQGNKSKLLDKSKQVNSKEIDSALELITTRSKAFDYWRSEQRNICNILKICPSDKEFFKQYFEDAFEYFKSIEEQEYKKIFDFVNKNYRKSKKYNEEGVVLDVYDFFLKENNNHFTELKLKAIIYAAYFEIINKKDSANG